jgi:hypothetical protein
MPRNKSLKIGDEIANNNLKVIDTKTLIEGKYNTKRGWSKVNCKLCGKDKWMRNNILKRKRTISCGCALKDSTKWNIKKEKNMTWQLEKGESAFNNLYYQYARSAENRNLTFELSKKDFRVFTKSLCYYCGREPYRVIKGQGKSSGDYIYNGIDRIENDIGYIMSNVVSCCFDCNSSKRTLSQKDFFEHITRIYNLHCK